MKNVPSSGSSSSSQTWGPVPAKDVSGTPNPGISAWLSPGNVTPIVESDHTLVPPPLPQRPPLIQSESMPMQERSSSSHNTGLTASPPVSHTPPILPIPPKNTSRTPSPDKKSGRVMLTTLRGQKDSKGRPTKTSKVPFSRKNTPQASSKAAGLAWDSTSKPVAQQSNQSSRPGSFAGHLAGDPNEDRSNLRPSTTGVLDARANSMSALSEPLTGPQTPADGSSTQEPPGPRSNAITQNARSRWQADDAAYSRVGPSENPTATENASLPVEKSRIDRKAPSKPALNYPSYRTEFPPTAPTSRATAEFNARVARRDPSPQKKALPTRPKSPSRKVGPREVNGISRRPVASSSSPRLSKNQRDSDRSPTSESNEDSTGDGRKMSDKKARETRRPRKPIPVDPELASSDNGEGGDANTDEPPRTWEERVKWIRKNLPKGVDEHAAKQIFNEIVVRGDEVHWPDVAGLEAAKTALKEAVVYPFLRPDLFMGLREPARGMLLFGPPGTGKTMLARAVATESRSTFFAISASSLTSKWLGESEKLVRALFLLAKALAPSIIFVDEIDSLLSSRGGSSEHETTRRIKTEFLIQWSDLQRAAAGKEKGEGDASRVLVLAATNMPWAIDEAARRRFVRRQYIPLPEAHVRGEQLRTLLGHQKHGLNKKDIQVLVELTDGKLHSPA